MNLPQNANADILGVLERMGRSLLVVLAVVGVLAPAVGFAQELDAATEEALAKLDDDGQAYEQAPVPASSVDEVNLDVHWRLWKRVFSNGKPGIEELEALTHDAFSIGYRNLPEYATAVYSMAASKVATGELSVREASKLYAAARKMAPDLPYVELDYSAHLLQNNLGRMPAAVGSYKRGLVRAVNWLDTRLSWELKLMGAGLVAFLVAVLFFLLAQLLRYFGIVAYDCARLLPRGFSSNQTVILIVALVIVPGLLLRSPLLSILILIAVLSTVQRINERLVTLAIFGMLLLLPSLDQRMSQQVQWPGSQTQELMHAQYLRCDEACMAGLEAQWLEAGDDDPVLAYTVALTQYRHGSAERLANVVEALEDQQWPTRMRPWVENLHGATLTAQAKPEAAIAHLEQATALAPDHPAAPYNLMRAYQMQNDVASAEAALDEAISINLQAVRTHLEMERRDVNSFLLVEPLPADVLWERHQAASAEHVSVISPVWKALSGAHIPLDKAPLLGIVGALIALLSLPLYLSGRASSPCPKCGMARDPRDAPQMGNHRYCLPCYHTFVSGASLDYNARVYNERVLGRRERFQDVLRRVLSVVMPGTGHSQAGHGLGGFIVSLLTAFGAIILLRPMGLWRPTFELFSDNWAAQQSVAWLLISIGAFVALTAAARGISSTETTDRTRARGGDND